LPKAAKITDPQCAGLVSRQFWEGAEKLKSTSHHLCHKLRQEEVGTVISQTGTGLAKCWGREVDCNTRSRPLHRRWLIWIKDWCQHSCWSSHFLGITSIPKCPTAGVFVDICRQSSLLTAREIIIKSLMQERATCS